MVFSAGLSSEATYPGGEEQGMVWFDLQYMYTHFTHIVELHAIHAQLWMMYTVHTCTLYIA